MTPEHAQASSAADQQNAAHRDERERSPDGMTASERAMAESDGEMERARNRANREGGVHFTKPEADPVAALASRVEQECPAHIKVVAGIEQHGCFVTTIADSPEFRAMKPTDKAQAIASAINSLWSRAKEYDLIDVIEAQWAPDGIDDESASCLRCGESIFIGGRCDTCGVRVSR